MLISSVLTYYEDKTIQVFEKFFSNKDRLKRYNNKNGNSFLAILKNPQLQTNSQKFINLINIMYFSDILFMVLCCEQFRKEEIINNFYFKTPEKYGELIKQHRPDLFDIDLNKDDEIEYSYNKHRILLDLCDDIALYNGYEPKELPSPWSVLREMYAIKSNKKTKEEINIYNLPIFNQ